jgi:hypothetical protein
VSAHIPRSEDVSRRSSKGSSSKWKRRRIGPSLSPPLERFRPSRGVTPTPGKRRGPSRADNKGRDAGMGVMPGHGVDSFRPTSFHSIPQEPAIDAHVYNPSDDLCRPRFRNSLDASQRRAFYGSFWVIAAKQSWSSKPSRAAVAPPIAKIAKRAKEAA